ncbi:MAG: fumarylacetoacetase [Francisellaceae bacterium]
MIEANNPELKSFIDIEPTHHFPIQNLPFGIFSDTLMPQKRVGVAIGDFILDLASCIENGLLSDTALTLQMVVSENLNDLMQQGRAHIREIRNAISRLLRDDNPLLRDNKDLQSKVLIKRFDATLYMPVKVAGYTDFYSSKEHATNIGKMFRDKDNPLLPNWVHIPVAYDGRAGSVVVSGQDIKRPCGQIRPDAEAPPIYAPCKGLDIEVEMGFFVGTPSTRGESIDIDEAPDHIFGMVLVNDWSARDIQKWEYVPLGPFLAKNFATSVSPWVVTLDALEPFRVESPKQEPEVLDYLKRKDRWGVDIQLEFSVKSADMNAYQTLSRTNYKYMYWDMMQQLVHHAVNGCPMNTGDLLASGTISGQAEDSFGSLIELTEGGKRPIELEDGSSRVFLKDGDSAKITGFCQGNGYRIGFGEVVGQVIPATPRMIKRVKQKDKVII